MADKVANVVRIISSRRACSDLSHERSCSVYSVSDLFLLSGRDLDLILLVFCRTVLYL